MNRGFASGFISSEIKSEVLNTKNGDMKKVRFQIALNRHSKDGGADFPWFAVYGKTAETIERYFSKGRGIYVEYHIRTGTYKNNESKTIYSEEKVVDLFEFPPVRKNEENTSNEETSKNFQETPSYAPTSNASNFMDIPEGIENELPFK